MDQIISNIITVSLIIEVVLLVLELIMATVVVKFHDKLGNDIKWYKWSKRLGMAFIILLITLLILAISIAVLDILF